MTAGARSRIALAFVAASFGVSSAYGQPSIELYRRVVPLATKTGVVRVAEHVEIDLEVAEGARRFARVYRLEFGLETRRTSAAGSETETYSRGTVHLALAASARDERAYDALLRTSLQQLSPAAFAQPFAGLRPERPPFGGAVATHTKGLSWLCSEQGDRRQVTRYSHEVEKDPDGSIRSESTGSTTMRAEDPATQQVCASLTRATRGHEGETLRTMPVPEILWEDVLFVTTRSTLPPELYADDLVALPDGITFTRREAPGVSEAESMHTSGTDIEASVIVDEIETRATLRELALPARTVRERAWHARWTFQRVERRLGVRPETQEVERWSLTTTLLPTAPPAEGGETFVGAGPYPVTIDEAALAESIAERLDLLAVLDDRTLADTLVRHARGFESPGFVLVLCFPDGRATWGLPPIRSRARLTNADVFCPEVDAALP